MSETMSGGGPSPAYEAVAMYRVRFARKVEVEGVKLRPGVEVEVRGDILAGIPADAIASAVKG